MPFSGLVGPPFHRNCISKFSNDTRGLVLVLGPTKTRKKKHKVSDLSSIGMIVIVGLVRLLARGDLMMRIEPGTGHYLSPWDGE